MGWPSHAVSLIRKRAKYRKRAERDALALYWYGIDHGVVDGPLTKLHKAGLCNNNWHDCPVCMIARLRSGRDTP